MWHLPSLDFKLKNNIPNILYRSFISYSCVLLLPLIMCSFYYFHSYTTLKERTRTNQSLLLENLGKQVDYIFNDAINLGFHLQLNNYVIALSNNKSTNRSSPIMDRYYLQKYLCTLQISNTLIQEINIYFPTSEYVLNSSSNYKISLLPYMEKKQHTLASTDWKQILDLLHNNKIVCYSNTEKNFITIAQPLLSDTSGKPLSILCIQIDKKILLDRLYSELLKEYPSTFALINQQGLLLTTASEERNSPTLPFIQVLDYFSSHSSTKPYTYDNLIINYYPLQIPDIALISIAEKSIYQAQQNQLIEIMLLTISLCIIIGIGVIMYYSYKSYKPISQILHFIKGTNTNVTTDQNEYHMIMKVLTQNHYEIAHQQELLKNNYLQKIFSGEIAFSQVPEQIVNQFSFQFSSSICVVLLTPKNSSDLNSVSNSTDLLVFIIKNVLGELLVPYFPEYYFSIRNHKIALLLNVHNQVLQPLLLIQQITEQLMSFLLTSFQIQLQAGISDINNKESISTAYLQADTALEYQRLFEAKKIYNYQCIPKDQIIGSVPLNTSEYLKTLVISCDAHKIKDYFHTLNEKLANNPLSHTDAKSCFYFFYQVTAQLQLYYQTHYAFEIESLNFISESFFEQSLPKALSQTCEAYLKACDEFISKSANSSNTYWARNICRFIENNYFDTNLNLNSIANHFQISPAYLSKKFKEQYQQSVIDYLYEVRITTAVSLLLETNLKISDIATMSGFVDSNAFIRIFKKLKGTTPGKYKDTVEGIL